MNYTDLYKTGLSLRELGAIFSMSHVGVKKAIDRGSSRSEKFERGSRVLLSLVGAGKLPMKSAPREKRRTNIDKIKAYVEKQLAA